MSVEKELFILSSVQCVNSDRQWRVVGLSVPVKSACVSIPCQVKPTASKGTVLILTFMQYSLNVSQRIYLNKYSNSGLLSCCFMALSIYCKMLMILIVVRPRIPSN